MYNKYRRTAGPHKFVGPTLVAPIRFKLYILLLLLYNVYTIIHTYYAEVYPLRLLHTSCARECKFTTRNVILSAPRLPGSTASRSASYFRRRDTARAYEDINSCWLIYTRTRAISHTKWPLTCAGRLSPL